MEIDTDVLDDEDMGNWSEENDAPQSKKIGSRAKAINQHCKDCIYDDQGGVGTWRQQVEACTVVKCALYEFRPISKPRK